eukprot:scaffold115055_cov19-Prasinocladus_malaysianus.AAC.1
MAAAQGKQLYEYRSAPRESTRQQDDSRSEHTAVRTSARTAARFPCTRTRLRICTSIYNFSIRPNHEHDTTDTSSVQPQSKNWEGLGTIMDCTILKRHIEIAILPGW